MTTAPTDEDLCTPPPNACSDPSCFAATGNPALGDGVIEATFTLGGALVVSSDTVHFITTTDKTIVVDGAAKTCTIALDGASYPCGDGSTDAVKPARGRGMFSRASFLTTKGAFTLSSGGPNDCGGGGRK